MLVIIRRELAHEFPLHVMQPGLLFESGVCLQEAIVDGIVALVKDDFDDAEPLDERVE